MITEKTLQLLASSIAKQPYTQRCSEIYKLLQDLSRRIDQQRTQNTMMNFAS